MGILNSGLMRYYPLEKRELKYTLSHFPIKKRNEFEAKEKSDYVVENKSFHYIILYFYLYLNFIISLL